MKDVLDNDRDSVLDDDAPLLPETTTTKSSPSPASGGEDFLSSWDEQDDWLDSSTPAAAVTEQPAPLVYSVSSAAPQAPEQKEDVPAALTVPETPDDLPEQSEALSLPPVAPSIAPKPTAVESAARINDVPKDFKIEAVKPEPEKVVPAAGENTTDKFYRDALEALYKAEDLGLSGEAKARIRKALDKQSLAQLSVRELLSSRVIGKVQLGRAVARVNKRRELLSVLDIPPEAGLLRKELDPKIINYLRNERMIPLFQKSSENQSRQQGELHIACDAIFVDPVKESALAEFLPHHKFIWHFAMREVCGAFWLSEQSDDVDSGMEAEALLDRILGNAIDARCSDIHIDPSIKGEPRAIVKYRVDGFVTPKEVITLDQLDKVRVRIENIARMPKVNLNHPNKGAFTRKGYDWRVQVQPHAGRQGPVPRIVLRRLHPDVMPMEQLGYPEYFIRDIKSAASAPNGVIFWTGPTGSGKTESIHSAIVSVNPMGKGLSLHTIEDPPEKRVAGYAVQMEIAEGDPARSGLSLLKSSLRADPDVIVFGEVRDEEMAGLVFEAANTGHLVFSTLHTNTSLDAIVRLDELGVYGFLVSYIRGVAAQRLVRRLCTHCRIKVEKPDELTESIFDRYGLEMGGGNFFRASPEGCISCNHTGYHGRIAICEWLRPNRELVEASTRRDYTSLEEIAIRAGWKPMGFMGALHIKNGITDAGELSTKVLELSTELV